MDLPKEMKMTVPEARQLPRRKYRIDAEDEETEEEQTDSLERQRAFLKEMTKTAHLRQTASKILTIVVDNQLRTCFTFWRGLALRHTGKEFALICDHMAQCIQDIHHDHYSRF